MSARRDARGRFAAKPLEELSPAYRRRIERGQQQSKSSSEARGHGTKPRPMWRSQEVAHKPSYQRVLDALNRMRQGLGLHRAAREAGTTPETVKRHAGKALTRDERGHYRAKPSDRLYRQMRFLDARGPLTVEPANSKEASKLAAYHNAVHHYLLTGDDQPLRRFRRMTLRTRHKTSLRFVTDLETLDRLAGVGYLSFEDLYQMAA